MALNVILGLLRAAQLPFKLLFLAFQLAKLVLELPQTVLCPVELASLLVQEAVLSIELLQIGFDIKVPALKPIDASLALFLHFFQLRPKG